MLASHNDRVAAGKRHRSDSDPPPPPEAAQEVKTQPGDKVDGKKGILVTEEQVVDCILQEIERRGWLCFRSAPCYRTGRRAGEPDLECWADKGRTFHLEVKRPVGGKLSTDQLGVIAWARKLGHEVFVVTSLSEFLDIVDGKHQNTYVQQH